MSIQLQSPLGLAMQGIQSPLAGIQQALQGLQQGLQGLTQLLRPLEAVMQNPIASAMSAAGQAVGQAIGQMGQLGNSPLGGLGQALGGIGQSLGGIGQALGGLTQGLNAFGQGGGAAAAANPLGAALGALGGLSQGLNGLNQAIGGLGQAAGGLAQAGLGAASGQLLGGLGQAIEGLSGALGAAGALAGSMGSIGGAGQAMTPDRAVAALAKGMQGSDMKMLDGKALDDAANGIRPKGMKAEDFTPEFQAACKFLKSDAGKETMRKLDTADADNAGGGLFKGRPDGKIGIGDVSAALQKTGLDGGQRSAVSTLRENFNALSKDGNTFDMDTLRDVAQGKNLPDGSAPTGQLRLAAQQFLQDKALSFAADNAQKLSEGHFNQQGDGKFSLTDLNKTLARG